MNQYNEISTLQYMGSKARIISHICDPIIKNKSIQTVVDLFAGTGSVGYALKPWFFWMLGFDYIGWVYFGVCSSSLFQGTLLQILSCAKHIVLVRLSSNGCSWLQFMPAWCCFKYSVTPSATNRSVFLRQANIGNIVITTTDIVQFLHHMYLHKSILRLKKKWYSVIKLSIANFV